MDDPIPSARDISDPAPTRSGVGVWVKRFGVLGFLFFLGKGLLWLTLPALLVTLGVGC